MTTKLCTIDTGVLNHAALMFTDKLKLGVLTETHLRCTRPELFNPDPGAPCMAALFEKRPNFYIFVWNSDAMGVDVFWGPKARKGK